MFGYLSASSDPPFSNQVVLGKLHSTLSKSRLNNIGSIQKIDTVGARIIICKSYIAKVHLIGPSQMGRQSVFKLRVYVYRYNRLMW